MEEQIISVQPDSKIVIEKVPGDLRIRGWEESELSGKTDGGLLSITDKDGVVIVSCDGDLILSLPQQASVEFTKVDGDLSVRGLIGAIKGDKVEGDASFSHVGEMVLKSVKGNFVLRHAEGAISVTAVGGDASVRHLNGDLVLENVGADLYIRSMQGNVQTTVGQDAVAYLQPEADASYLLTAGQDIVLRLPSDVDLTLSATSGAANGIRVNLSDMVDETFSGTFSKVMGNGSARATLTAGGRVLITSRVDEWEARVDFDVDDGSFVWEKFANIGEEVGARMGDLGARMGDLGAEIGNRVAERMVNVQVRGERARERAEAAARRAELKAEAAMRRAEIKMRHAEKNMKHVERRVHRWEGRVTTTTPARPVVSDEERMAILRMLAEKKITAAQAESLLSALEGGK